LIKDDENDKNGHEDQNQNAEAEPDEVCQVFVRTPATGATTTDSVHTTGPTLHIPMHTNLPPLQPYEQQELDRDMRKYGIDAGNNGERKRRLFECISRTYSLR